MLRTFSIVCMLACFGVDTSGTKFSIIDLTHELGESTIYWPGNPAFNFTILNRGMTNGGFWFESNYVGQAEHGGTHMDAPSHFYKDRWRTHQIPIENLYGPAVIIDVKTKASNNSDYRVTPDDINMWEKQNGKIPEKAVVIMNSGWGDKYPNKTEVFGTETPDSPTTFHFPGWHGDTAKWLIKERNIRILGVDTPSNDYAQSTTFPVHIELAKNNVLGLENVANLDKLQAKGSYVFAAVIKLKDGSGGPVRIFAQTFENLETSSAMPYRPLTHVYVFITLIAFIYQ